MLLPWSSCRTTRSVNFKQSPRNWKCGTWHLDFFSAVSTAAKLRVRRRAFVGKVLDHGFYGSVSLDRTFAGFCPWHFRVQRPAHGRTLCRGIPTALKNVCDVTVKQEASERYVKTTNRGRKHAHVGGQLASRMGATSAANLKRDNVSLLAMFVGSAFSTLSVRLLFFLHDILDHELVLPARSVSGISIGLKSVCDVL